MPAALYFDPGVLLVKLLIAAGETVSELSELPVGVRSLVEAASEILVMSPASPDGSIG